MNELLGILGPFLSMMSIFPSGNKIDDLMNKSKADKEEEQTLGLARDNLNFQKDISNQNLEFQKQQFNYQKELNNLVMQREDNAIQRRIADLKKAGLSPLMANDGAQAGSLVSAPAPQYDSSGITHAVSNIIGAYNDAFSRKMQRQQFALQSKVQKAQLYADLLQAQQSIQKSKLDIEYQKGLNEWSKEHGYRNTNPISEITLLVEKLLGINPSSADGGSGNGNIITDIITTKPKDIIDNVGNILEEKTNNVKSNILDNARVIQNNINNKKQTKNAQKKIKQADDFYTKSINILSTRAPNKYNLSEDKYINALTYVYNNSSAKGRYISRERFLEALKNAKNRKEFIKSFDKTF